MPTGQLGKTRHDAIRTFAQVHMAAQCGTGPQGASDDPALSLYADHMHEGTGGQGETDREQSHTEEGSAPSSSAWKRNESM